ncbi:lytic transglycosylase [Hyphomicrobium methylovorum]|nr:lytic transglycosylase domain-containing protein [Hyphomicrobium methylovorum]MBA2125273.1 lytic transglycosylase [Hyphomicrobium methylovorum]
MPTISSSVAPFSLRRRASFRAFAGLFALAVAGFSVPASAQGTPSISPAPTISAAEKQHLAKLDAALAPLLSVTPSSGDASRLREASAAVRKRDIDAFMDARNGISDPVARKLADWIRLRWGLGKPAEFQAFLRDNPLWPNREMITQRLEEALFKDGGSAQEIKDFLKNGGPQTGVGNAALASAYLAEGNTQKARALAAKVWREMTIAPELESGFIARFGKLLTPADHKWRFDRMVTNNVRFAANRVERAAAAKRLIPLLPASEQKIATARLAVFNRAKNADSQLAAVSSGESDDHGLDFHRVQMLRKAGKIEEASRIILSVPTDPKKIAELDEWWAERRELAYGALKAGKMQLAYRLVKDAGPLSVNPLKDQTFMAGWIALRYLNNPTAAERHFQDMAKAADGPLSRAKSAYWLGRVSDARGDRAGAMARYQLAAKNPDTFHGLLAMQVLDPERRSIKITPPALPTAEQIRNFNTLDAAKALIIAGKANLSRAYTRSFLTGLQSAFPSEAEGGIIAHIAEVLGDPQMSLRLAKSSVARGQNLLMYSYPVKPFPAYKPLRPPPETALLLGIARQETEFEPQTISGAGAKGMLQVMTITANHVCRDYKIKCQIAKLTTDTPYNVMIASAYIADRMQDFKGSYVLGLAGYNAGPGRARQWIRENGDPRDPNVDTVDWIERIPFKETREYVTKVLANIQIYRSRLGDTKNALRMQQDLIRIHDGQSTGSANTRARPSGNEG